MGLFSSQGALGIMLVVAWVIAAIIVAYTGWAYRVIRESYRRTHSRKQP